MVDILDEGPSLALKRGPDKSAREAKRAKVTCSRQDERNEINHVSGEELAPSEELAPGDTAEKVGEDIQRVLVAETARWMLDVPRDIWLMVSHTHMVAQLYWQTRLTVDQSGVDAGNVPSPLAVVGRLAHWLRPVLPDAPPGDIHRCLELTRLHLVIEVHLEILRRAKLLGMYFSNDFATEQRFDAMIHAKMIEAPLHPGDLCLVVFPATLIGVAAAEPLRVVSKRFVLPLQAPVELGSLLQELRAVTDPPMRTKESVSTSSTPGARQPFDEGEALLRDAIDAAERKKECATPSVDAPTKSSRSPELAPDKGKSLESLLLDDDSDDVDGPGEAVPAPLAPLDGEKEVGSRGKSTHPGEDPGRVGPSAKPSDLEALPTEELPGSPATSELLMRANSDDDGSLEEAAPAPVAQLDGEGGADQSKRTRPGGDPGGVWFSVKPSGLGALPAEELEKRWRSCWSSLGLPGMSARRNA